MGQSTPVITAYVNSPVPDFIGAINQANVIIILLSLIPTPILVLVYFKPVRALEAWKEEGFQNFKAEAFSWQDVGFPSLIEQWKLSVPIL